MTDRYEISAQRWAMIETIVSPPQRMGRPRRNDRQMLNGILWILCSRAKWRDLPERFGPWKTVYQRFRQWRDNGPPNKLHKPGTLRSAQRLFCI